MKKVLLFLVLPIIILTSLSFLRSFINSFSPVASADFEEPEEIALEKKIGQLFIIGIEGKEPSREMEELIKEVQPGGVLLLGRNIESRGQVKKLTSFLQKVSLENTGFPLLIAVDQEGGLVSRVEWAEKTPQAMIADPRIAEKIGKLRGEDLKELGINVNLAPVLEKHLRDDFLFGRGFQRENYASLASSFIQGQKHSGVFTCIKHFPGYVGISFNPEERLAFVEEVPDTSVFKEASRTKPEIVMLSNAVYEEIDESLPFSFTPKGIKLLEKEVQGNPLVVSDDLSQNSLLYNFTL